MVTRLAESGENLAPRPTARRGHLSQVTDAPRRGSLALVANWLPASVVDAFRDCLFRGAPETSHHQRRHDGNARHNDPIRNGRDSHRDRRKADRNHPANEKQRLGILGEHETSVATGQHRPLFRIARCPAWTSHAVGRQGPAGRLTRDSRGTCGDRSVVKDDTQQRTVHLDVKDRQRRADRGWLGRHVQLIIPRASPPATANRYHRAPSDLEQMCRTGQIRAA